MEERKIVLAIGAHAGDMEVSCGAVLYKHVRQGDRVVLLHLTPGEGGNPRMTPAAYGAQKRREAEAIAKVHTVTANCRYQMKPGYSSPMSSDR